MSVLLHVGLHKTGTTSIQSFLRAHEPELAALRARFPLGYLQLNCHFELPLALLRPDRLTPTRTKGDDWRNPGWRDEIAAQVDLDLIEHQEWRTIISCEELSLFRHDDEFGRLHCIVGDATVVFYRRRLDAWLDSLIAENAKRQFGASADPNAFNCTGRLDAWIADHDRRIEQWRRWFTKVVVVDYDEAVDQDGSVLPSFCRIVGLQPPPANEWWLNRRGTKNEGRVAGTRWTGGRYAVAGDQPVDVATYLHSGLPVELQ